jgi:hypothetical protein
MTNEQHAADLLTTIEQTTNEQQTFPIIHSNSEPPATYNEQLKAFQNKYYHEIEQKKEGYVSHNRNDIPDWAYLITQIIEGAIKYCLALQERTGYKWIFHLQTKQCNWKTHRLEFEAITQMGKAIITEPGEKAHPYLQACYAMACECQIPKQRAYVETVIRMSTWEYANHIKSKTDFAILESTRELRKWPNADHCLTFTVIRNCERRHEPIPIPMHLHDDTKDEDLWENNNQMDIETDEGYYNNLMNITTTTGYLNETTNENDTWLNDHQRNWKKEQIVEYLTWSRQDDNEHTELYNSILENQETSDDDNECNIQVDIDEIMTPPASAPCA